MGRARQKKYDKLSYGLVTGIMIPLVIFFGIYLARYSEIPVKDYLINLWQLKVTFKILSLCGFANLMVFFLFFRKKMDKAARGIIMATFLYALLFLLFEII
ncbi:MAG: hypothetical protein ACOZDD_07870 [Bacteroidota bacterium]